MINTNVLQRAIEMITAYQNLIKEAKSNPESLIRIFNEAKQTDFNFTTTNPLSNIKKDEILKLHLGVADNKLQAILTKKDFTLNDTTVDFLHVRPFSNVKTSPKSSIKTGDITQKEFELRASKWNEKSITEWVENNLKADTVVEYFEIKANNFTPTKSNLAEFGISSTAAEKISNHIDLMTISIDGGYMDIVRPVPPFKPTTF